MNKNCIFFAISADYVFTAANVIMGLKKHSAELLQTCDVLIYHDGISERDKMLLSNLHNSIIYKNIIFPNSYREIVEAANRKKWGIYVLPKLFGFELVKKYEKVLFLDTDIVIAGDILEIFNIKEEIAWRNVIAWNPNLIFASVINAGEHISGCSGGVIYFTSKLNQYNITDADIVDAYEKTIALKNGGLDERIISYIVYKKKMVLKELDVIFNQPAGHILPGCDSIYKIIHFLDSRKKSTKPWKNLAAYLYFKDWTINYKEWINMGGEGPINFTDKDYWALFGFKELDEINKLKNKLKEKETLLKEKSGIIQKMQKRYDDICNSRIWRATKSTRILLDKIKRLIK